MVKVEEMNELDLYMLAQLHQLEVKVRQNYDAFQFHTAAITMSTFVYTQVTYIYNISIICLLSFNFCEKIQNWDFFQNIKNDCEKIYKPQRKNK